MAEPFSIGAGVVGVLSLTIKISQMLFDFGLRWRDAPKDVRALRLALLSLRETLSEMEKKLFNNQGFEDAFDGGTSALLSHLKDSQTSKSAIKEAFEDCHKELTQLIEDLKTKAKGSKVGWERFRAAFQSNRIQSTVSQLQQQCQTLNQLIAIDVWALAANSYKEIRQSREDQQGWHEAGENLDILRWLSPLSFEEKHRDILSKLHPGTGEWLLGLDQFKMWRKGLSGAPSTLWTPGIPGAGKSVLASKVVDHLQQFSKGDNVAVLYIYCDYNESLSQTDRNLFASLAKQSVLQQDSLPDDARTLYSQCRQGDVHPSSEQCLRLLLSSTKVFRRTYIVVDALDEHLASDPDPDDDDGLQIPLLNELNAIQLQVPTSLSLLITSRIHLSIESQMPHHSKIVIEAHDEDVRHFVDARIQDSGKFKFAKDVAASPDLANEIVAKLVKAAQGMFLLPYLHLQRLNSQPSVRKLRKAINDLPSKLDDTFEDAMSRIQSQPEEKSQLALQTLSWLSKAQEPLQASQLQHALAVEPEDTEFEADGLILVTEIVSVCAGLVNVDFESGTIRLVHFSVEEYFKRSSSRWFPDAERLLAITCMTYASFTVGQQIDFDDHEDYEDFEDSMGTLRLNYPLLIYATRYWAFHVDQVSSPLPSDVQEASRRFLDDGKKTGDVLNKMFEIDPEYWLYNRGKGLKWLPDPGDQVLGVHLVFFMQCESLAISPRFRGEIVHAQTSEGLTALGMAAMAESTTNIKILLESGPDIEHRNHDGQTPLWLAAHRGWDEGVMLLLERGADPNAQCRLGRAPLHFLFHDGGGVVSVDRSNSIDALLNRGADIEAVDRRGDTPLGCALIYMSYQSVTHLISKGANVHHANHYGWTLWHLMSMFLHHRQCLQILDDDGRCDIDAIDHNGKTALMWAVRCGNFNATKLLLEFGADPNIVDDSGETALMHAAPCHNYDTTKLLLKSGADPNIVDDSGETALMHAAQCHNYDTTKLLLKSGADPNIVDVRFSRTALMHAARKSRSFKKNDAYPNVVNQRRKTLLIESLRKSFSIEKLLLHLGADVNAVDNNGWTALMFKLDLILGERILKNYKDPNLLQLIRDCKPLSDGLSEPNRKAAMNLVLSFEYLGEPLLLEVLEALDLGEHETRAMESMRITNEVSTKIDTPRSQSPIRIPYCLLNGHEGHALPAARFGPA